MSDKNRNIYTYEKWDDLARHINRFSKFPWYIYRGQRKSDWLLEPTLSRELKKIKETDKKGLVKNHLDKFKINIRGRRGMNPPALTENDLWALGQHFGLHTPLLDWTHSPYVAIFFALSSNKKSETGYRSLWLLNTSDINRINNWHEKNNKSEDFKVELINPISDENNRLVNQNGIFTKLNVSTDIESWATNCNDEVKYEVLVKINIAEGLRDEALLFLDLMNINYSSLFPDLIGSSLDANMRLEQLDYLSEQRQQIWDKYNKDHTDDK